MATNYTDLKGEIKAQIKPNGVGAITGQVLQDAMLNLVEATEAEMSALNAATDEKLAQLDQEVGVRVEDNDETEDFSLADENGNVLLQLAQGHIRTKNFNSAEKSSLARHRRFGFIGTPNLYLADLPTSVCTSSTKASEVYAIYDELVTLYPDYVNKSEIGKDSAGNSIYQYTFAHKLPPYGKSVANGDSYDITYGGWETDPRPVELIISGVHGDEKGAVWGLALLMKDLCNATSEDAMSFVKNNVVVKVIPIVNVWGFDANTRLNYNGVNLNRDYVSATQAETMVVKKFYSENYDNAICIYDYHNTVAEGNLWNNSKQFTTQSMLLAFSREIQADWKKRDASLVSYDDMIVYNDFDVATTSEGFFFLNYGELSSVVESSRATGGLKGINTISFDALGTKSGMDILGNMMIMAITLMR